MAKDIPQRGTPEWYQYQETLNVAFKALRITQEMEKSVQVTTQRPGYKDREARQRIVKFVEKNIDTE